LLISDFWNGISILLLFSFLLFVLTVGSRKWNSRWTLVKEDVLAGSFII